MPSIDFDPATLVAGDDWHIVGTLLDRAGNPVDLTYASIAWTLLDPSGAPLGASAIITVIDPPRAGIVSIKLTEATTATLAPGHYIEALRVTRPAKPRPSRAYLYALWQPILLRIEGAPISALRANSLICLRLRALLLPQCFQNLG